MKLKEIIIIDGGLIPVYLHKLPVKFANVKFNAPLGFSENLGVGFNSPNAAV
jgi:hypothetical protein